MFRDALLKIVGGGVAPAFKRIVSSIAADQAEPVIRDHFKALDAEGRARYARRLRRIAEDLEAGENGQAAHKAAAFVGEIKL